MSKTHDDLHAAMEPLDALSFPLWGSRLIEASAGTGKTYTIASLYVRLVLGHNMPPEQRALTPPDILVVTFTRAATRELRDRIRRRLNEAAACFLGETEGDGFLQALRDEYPESHWAGCARQLEIAAQWMDDAAVSTIDAWCYRMLREHAFDSGSPFNVEMDLDAAETVAEATQDYWRLHIAPLAADDFARVSKVTGKASRLASSLYFGWLAHTALYPASPTPAELVAGLKADLQACKQQPWLQWVPEMQEILDQADAAGHVNKRLFQKRWWQPWLDQLLDWANDPVSIQPFASGKAWERLVPAGLAEIWKQGEPPDHPGFSALESLSQQIRSLDSRLDRVWVHAACWVSQRVAELRRQRTLLDFNGLLEHLDAALQGTNGDRLAQLIRSQFPAALIDEFQDTNPIQYRIFDRIYGVDTNSKDVVLALIGDPKQAIYGFRGADIHSYLAARRACEGRLYTLGSNYRSSAEMVAAVNHLFQVGEQQREKGAFLFQRGGEGSTDNPVPFLPVTAARDPGEFLVQGRQPSALTIWRDMLPEKRNNDVRKEDVAAACASEILRLLQLGAEGEAGFQTEQGFQPLLARDIAILVNTGDEAKSLKAQLAMRGIRSVYLSDKSSVFASAAASEMLAWLRACAEPENGGYVRVALATASLGLNWSELDAFVHDEVCWEAMLERFAVYKEQWRRRGVLPMLRRFMHEFGVPARLFAQQEATGHEGERHLTNLLHLAELLQAASSSLDGERALIRYLEEQVSRGGEGGVEGDASQLRLESDAGLVQIVTVHKAKGLEYPLVFYPFGYYCRFASLNELPVVYRDEQGRRHVLASSNDADSSEQETILAYLEHERLAEDLRKLYVALTRARHATWMAVSPYATLPRSAMGYLLGGAAACTPATLDASLEEFAGACEHIDIQPMPEASTGRYRPVEGPATEPVWRSMGRRIQQHWTLSSYSALSRLATDSIGVAPGEQPDAAAQSLPDAPSTDTFLETYLADEGLASEIPESDGPASAEGAAAGIHDFPKGAKAGSFLHDLLEWVFTQGPQIVLADPQKLREHVQRRCSSRGWQSHADALVEWLQDFFSRAFRIAPEEGSAPLVLSGLDAVIPEMEFWFGIEQADLPALDALVSRHFLAGQPRALISKGQLHGLLRGFIDLVFEHEGRYYVADYKSNWLGKTADAYHAEAVSQAILKHRYDLQSALYLFALHRLLKSRLGADYDYDRHVGGALVFFIRGTRSASQGLHMERPPRQVMEQMEALFSRKPQLAAATQAEENEGASSCN